MRVVSSNCGCCAIKHIRDFPNSPEFPVYSLGHGHDEDQSSTSPEPYENWAYYQSAYEESSGNIFRNLVAEIKRRRPAGMITLNLVEHYERDDDEEIIWYKEQVDNWDPLLTELGFEKLPPFLNSNSGNRIHHYYLVYDEGDWEAD